MTTKQRFNKLLKLQKQQDDIMRDADATLSTSGYGQASPCYHKLIDKAYEINKQMAEIWNDIRSLLNSRGNTLWQEATKLYPVKAWGEENVMPMRAEQAIKLYYLL